MTVCRIAQREGLSVTVCRSTAVRSQHWDTGVPISTAACQGTHWASQYYHRHTAATAYPSTAAALPATIAESSVALHIYIYTSYPTVRVFHPNCACCALCVCGGGEGGGACVRAVLCVCFGGGGASLQPVQYPCTTRSSLYAHTHRQYIHSRRR